jgi:hypothetical protein
LTDVSTGLTANLKTASDSFAAGMGLAQAGDPASVARGLVKYADFKLNQQAVSGAHDAYVKALAAAEAALAAWQTAVAAEADANSEVIARQLDADAADAIQGAKQQTRDQDAAKEALRALHAPKAKAS